MKTSVPLLSCFFQSKGFQLRVSPFPALTLCSWHCASGFQFHSVLMDYTNGFTFPHRSLCTLFAPSQKAFGGISLFAGPTFLHRGDPSGWQDGHCDPARLKATLLWSNLLLSTPTPLQLMSCKSQRHCPESCSKQHLTQAWREPQLREDRL